MSSLNLGPDHPYHTANPFHCIGIFNSCLCHISSLLSCYLKSHLSCLTFTFSPFAKYYHKIFNSTPGRFSAVNFTPLRLTATLTHHTQHFSLNTIPFDLVYLLRTHKYFLSSPHPVLSSSKSCSAVTPSSSHHTLNTVSPLTHHDTFSRKISLLILLSVYPSNRSITKYSCLQLDFQTPLPTVAHKTVPMFCCLGQMDLMRSDDMSNGSETFIKQTLHF